MTIITIRRWFPQSKPYGANKEMIHWASVRKLRYAPTAHCLHWVAKGRCAVRICDEGHMKHPWMDHLSGWIGKDGRRVLLCQPYTQTPASMKSLIQVCDEFDLVAHINGNGWYGCGTIAIELESRSQYEKMMAEAAKQRKAKFEKAYHA